MCLASMYEVPTYNYVKIGSFFLNLLEWVQIGNWTKFGHIVIAKKLISSHNTIQVWSDNSNHHEPSISAYQKKVKQDLCEEVQQVA